MDFWDRHPRWFIFGVAVLVVAAIFALPIVLFCVFWQAMFMLAILLLNILIPKPTTVVAFHLGSGFLDSGIGAAIGFFLLLGRWTIDIIQIKWIYIVANIIFFLVSIQVAFQEYGSNVHSFFNFFPTHPALASWLGQGVLGFLLVAVPLGLIAIHAINKASSETFDTSNDTSIPKPTVYAAPPATPAHSPPAHVVQTVAGFDRAAWYKQIARENAGHGFNRRDT
jgi:hypothetical protein